MSHRQQGAWAGGLGPRAMQLGSESVQVRAGPLSTARACAPEAGRVWGPMWGWPGKQKAPRAPGAGMPFTHK